MKRCLSILLAAVLLLSCIPLGAVVSAATIIKSGTTGDCTWTLDNTGHLTISGNGALEIDYSYNASPWGTNILSVTIEKGVTTIGDDAFYGCANLTSVVIPEGVTSIGGQAFYNCTGLVSVDIPDSVVHILGYAFIGCDNLVSVSLPDSLTYLGHGAFQDCEKLNAITIPDTVTHIGSDALSWTAYYYDSANWDDGALYNGKHLLDYHHSKGGSGDRYVVKEGTLTIAEGAFDDFYSDRLTTVTIPDSVTHIGDYAFRNCDDLSTIVMGDGVVSIGSETFDNTAFYNDSANWENKMLYIGQYLIRTDPGFWGACSIKPTTRVVADHAFDGCTGVSSVVIPEGIKVINDAMFYGCTELASVTIPASVTSIGAEAFCDCDSLTSIVIPDSVTSIGAGAFAGCDGLTELPSLPKGVAVIADALFKDCDSLSSVTIPDSVTTIGDYAFEYCDSLSSVTIPDSITTIGAWAFGYCYNLASVSFGDSVTIIGGEAFYSCNLTSVTIPVSVTTIGGDAFDVLHVWYAGTESDRQRITFGSGKYDMANATWHYNTCPDTHRYSGVCDARCNLCEWERAVEKNHTYTNSCDATCNVCGATRSDTSHKYTNACDTTCNTCGATRTIKHDYKAATCTKAKTCKVCGATSGKALGHKYTNTCDTVCNTCGATRTVSHTYKTVTKKATTTANGYTVKRCSVCSKETGKTTLYKASSVALSKTSYTYNGKVQKPSVTVKDSNGKTISSSHYTVKYASGCKNVGIYKVTVTFKGNYSGSKTLTFKINPVKTSISKLTGSKKALKVTWSKKSTQVTGYQIQYSTDKKFQNYQSEWLTSYKKTSLSVSGLKAKTTYYVRVRTYKIANGEEIYSGWSTVKYVKTK